MGRYKILFTDVTAARAHPNLNENANDKPTGSGKDGIIEKRIRSANCIFFLTLISA
jgi:hypothetical protein